jgi:hypothetical protein
MRNRELVLFTALGSLMAWPLAFAQQPPPTGWPDPPVAHEQTTPTPKAPAKKPRKKPPVEQNDPDPRLEEEPPPEDAGPVAPAPPKPAAVLNIRCDGPFAKDTSHAKLAKAFGARNVAAAGGATVLFPNDPKRRLEVTWRDAAGRARPASILVEGQSTWRVRGFRLGKPLAQVEKANGKPFKLVGFADGGGNARDWQGGALDKLSGGCLLGMRFAPNPKTAAEARNKVSSGELASDSPDVRAVKATIVEMIVGYAE